MDNDQRMKVIDTYKGTSPGEFVLVHEPFRIEVINRSLTDEKWCSPLGDRASKFITIWQPRSGGWSKQDWYQYAIKDPRAEPWMANKTAIFFKEERE